MKTASTEPAFSLFELLAVLGILLIVLALAAPAVNPLLRGSQLTQGAQMLKSELGLARQIALAKNRSVEVRFYKLAGSEGSSEGRFRAFQVFEFDELGHAKPIGKLVSLPGSVIMDSGSALSSLLDTSRTKAWSTADPQIELPGVGTNYEARAFQFRPDGSTDLLPIGQQWFITLHNGTDGDSLSELPRNFYMLQVDAVNGRVRSYRP